jgi:hypothetical protein
MVSINKAWTNATTLQRHYETFYANRIVWWKAKGMDQETANMHAVADLEEAVAFHIDLAVQNVNRRSQHGNDRSANPAQH